MMTWINAIILGAKLFTLFTVLVTLPLEISKIGIRKLFNPVKVVTDLAMAFYFACLAAVVFFPLPTASQAVGLTYRMQIIPCYALWDIAVNPSVSAVLQVVFNVVMTIPFGIFMGYRFGFSTKKTVIASLLLSLFIETAQFTGLFGMYHGSFRLCDVDDLMLNTLGGFIGALVYTKINHMLPSLEKHMVSWKDGVLAFC